MVEQIFRMPTPQEKEEYIDIMTIDAEKLKQKKTIEALEAFFSAKSRTLLKESKDIKSLKLGCFRHAKLGYLIGKIPDIPKEAYEQCCFLEYEKTEADAKPLKNIITGEAFIERSIHILFRCRKCKFGNAFGFEPRQLQPETLALIDQTKYDA